MGKEDYLLTLLDGEGEILEEHCAVVLDGCESFDLEYLIACLTFHLEDDAWVLACRRQNLVDIELFEHLLARGGLLALGGVGREPAYELFEFLALLIGLGLLVLCLLEGEL